MQRRSFLTGLGALALGQGLMGCSQPGPLDLQAYFLRGTAPGPIFSKFQPQVAGGKLDLKPTVTMAELFSQLRSWYQELQQSNSSDNPNAPPLRVVSLGDYWLGPAIAQGLIQPLNPAAWPQWSKVPQIWQGVVSRNRSGYLASDTAAQVWGAPYRWGMTAMVYRPDKFKSLGWQPSDWSDLWKPELRQRFSLLDSPREVIGLTLKKMGRSYNTINPKDVAGLTAELAKLNQQVKYYSSDTYLQALLRGDTWLAVGWSQDILVEARQDDSLKVVVPNSGTALWTDIWVSPKGRAAATPTDAATQLLNQWCDFWWQPEIASQLSQFGDALSPLLADAATLASNPSPIPGFAAQALLPKSVSFDRHEFLEPLPPETIQQFRDLWLGMRKVVTG
jgi:putative spermidine/putrescine transport system substrate-binding protein